MPGNIIFIELADGNIQVPILPEGYAFLYDVNTPRIAASLDTYSGETTEQPLYILAQEAENGVLTVLEEQMVRNGFPQGKYITTPISLITGTAYHLKQGETPANAIIRSTVSVTVHALLPLPLKVVIMASHLSRLIQIPEHASRTIRPMFYPDAFTMIRAIQAPGKAMDIAIDSFTRLLIETKDYPFSDYPPSENTFPPGPWVTPALPTILFHQRMRLFPESMLQHLIAVHKQVFGEALDPAVLKAQFTGTLSGPKPIIQPFTFVPESIRPKSIFQTNSFMRGLKELTSRIYLDDSDRIEIQIHSDGSVKLKIGTKAISATWSRLHGFQKKREKIDSAQSRFQRAEAEYANAVTKAVSKLNAEDSAALDAIRRAAQNQGQRKQNLQHLKRAFDKLNDRTAFKIYKHSKEIRKQATQAKEQCNTHKETVARDDTFLLCLEAIAHAQNDDLLTASKRVQDALKKDSANPLATQLGKHIESQQLTKQAITDLSAGRFARANEQAQEALHLNPENTAARDLISIAQSHQTTEHALSALLQNREIDAFESAQKALELYPDNFSAKQILQIQAARGDLFKSQIFTFALDHSVPWIASKLLSQESAKKISQTILSCTHILTEIIQNTARYQEACALASLGFTEWKSDNLRQIDWSGGFRIADNLLTMLSAYSKNPEIQRTKVLTHLISSVLTTRSALTAKGGFNLLPSTLALINTVDAIQCAMDTLAEFYPTLEKDDVFRRTRLRLLLISTIRQNDATLKMIDFVCNIQLLVQFCPALIKNQIRHFAPTMVRDFFGKPLITKLLSPHTLMATYIGKLVLSIHDAYRKNRIERQNQLNKIEYGAFFMDALCIVLPEINRRFLNSTRFVQTINLFQTLIRAHISTLTTFNGTDILLETQTFFSSRLLKKTFSTSDRQNLSLYFNIFRSALPLLTDAAEHLALITPEKGNISRTYIEPALELTAMAGLSYRTVLRISSWPNLPNPGRLQCGTSAATIFSYGCYLYEYYRCKEDDLPEHPVYLFLKATTNTIATDLPFNLYQVTLLYPSISFIPTPLSVLLLPWVLRKSLKSLAFQNTNNRLSNIHRLIEKNNYSKAAQKLQKLPPIDSFSFGDDFNHQLDYLKVHRFLCGIGSLDCNGIDLEAFVKKTTGAHEQTMLHLHVLDDLKTAQRHIVKAMDSGSIFDFLDKKSIKNTNYQVQIKIARRNMLLIDVTLKGVQMVLSSWPELNTFIDTGGVSKITHLPLPHVLELIREILIYSIHFEQYSLELKRKQLLQNMPESGKKYRIYLSGMSIEALYFVLPILVLACSTTY